MNAMELPRWHRKILKRRLDKENRKFGSKLQEVPLDETGGSRPIQAFRNRHYLVQIYHIDDNCQRLTVTRTEIDVETGKFKDKIPFDDLWDIKDSLFPNKEAVEIYPKREDFINDCNMRHLWVFNESPLENGFHKRGGVSDWAGIQMKMAMEENK